VSYEDRAKSVREGEELDLQKLAPYLRRELGEEGELTVEQFPGGHSNLTYLLKLGDRELVLRRPPFGSKVKRAHDMGREHRVLSKLCKRKRWAPAPLLFCDDHDVIGADFYVMERKHGVVLRRKLPEGLTIDEAAARRLSETLLDTFVELHAIDYEAVGLGDLGKPEGFVRRQVEGWTRRYDKSQTDDIPQMPKVAKWLADNMPESPPPTIIHNDFKFDNVMYASTAFEEIVAVLDWEMATVGDPLMDLGTSLSYWVQADDPPPLVAFAFGPTMLPGMMTRTELAERYGEATGRDVSNIHFYYTFGLFKNAVVAQQIYYRYHQGVTKDERFAQFIDGVRLLALMAEQAVTKQSL
jgi:aminoglycoside phosphotransferase (APT) family kinase protein